MDQGTKQKLDAWTEEMNLDFGEPMTEDGIREMEKKLDLKVPPAYREFLLSYGCIPSLDILGSVLPEDSDVLLGSGEYPRSALGMTLKERNSEYAKLPRDLIVVRVEGNGILDCVVGEGERFGQVVYWDCFRAPTQAYPNIPKEEWFSKNLGWEKEHINGKKKDFWLAGYDFWDYLFRIFQKKKELNKGEDLEEKYRIKREHLMYNNNMIEIIQFQLKLELPKSYKAFLSLSGTTDIGGFSVVGISDKKKSPGVVRATQVLRVQRPDISIPLVPVSFVFSKAICLDISRANKEDAPLVEVSLKEKDEPREVGYTFSEWLECIGGHNNIY